MRTKTQLSLGHPPQRFIFRIDQFEYRIRLVVSLLVEPADNLLLEAVDLGFKSGVPGIYTTASAAGF